MDTRLRELRSSPDEGSLRGGERQARAAFRLASRDPTVLRLILLEAFVTAGSWALLFLFWREAESTYRTAQLAAAWLYWPFVTAFATACSVAVAFAIDASIDEAADGLRMAFSRVRRRLPVVVSWWLASTAALIALILAARAVMRPFPALLAVSVVWGLGTLFVVPAIALLDGGPLQSLGEAVRMLRRRWGRALSGLFAIGFLFGLALIPCVLLLRASLRGGVEPLWGPAGALFLFYLVYALSTATRGGFAVILARDALGDLPGEPPVVAPRRRLSIVFSRVILGALAVMVALFLLAALLGRHRSNPQPPTQSPPAAASPVEALAVPIREPGADRLRPGAPVLLEGRPIGRVAEVHVERAPLVEVFFEFDSRRASVVIHGQKKVTAHDGTVSLIVVPD